MKYYLTALLCLLSANAAAHQPVMDMAPRWNDGYGVQTRITHDNDTTTAWLEGVYTFKPSLRITAKMPFVDGELGDAIVAVPLKKYRNDGAFTSNWGFTPSVRMPTGGGSDWDAGLSISYNSETPGLYQLYDVYAIDDTVGVDINVGPVYADGNGSSWFTLLDVTAVKANTGEYVLSGPVLVYFKRNVIFRAEYKFEVHDEDSAWDGNYASVGIGLVY